MITKNNVNRYLSEEDGERLFDLGKRMHHLTFEEQLELRNLTFEIHVKIMKNQLRWFKIQIIGMGIIFLLLLVLLLLGMWIDGLIPIIHVVLFILNGYAITMLISIRERNSRREWKRLRLGMKVVWWMALLLNMYYFGERLISWI